MNKKIKVLIVFIVLAFIIILALIFGNINNSKEKLIKVLENNSFECQGNKCERIYTEGNCESSLVVDFSKYEYVSKGGCISNDYGESIGTIIYNWKISSLKHTFVVPNDNINQVAILDENGEFSCDAGTTDECYPFLKSLMLEHKNSFNEYLIEADIDIESIK